MLGAVYVGLIADEAAVGEATGAVVAANKSADWRGFCGGNGRLLLLVFNGNEPGERLLLQGFVVATELFIRCPPPSLPVNLLLPSGTD